MNLIPIKPFVECSKRARAFVAVPAEHRYEQYARVPEAIINIDLHNLRPVNRIVPDEGGVPATTNACRKPIRDQCDNTVGNRVREYRRTMIDHQDCAVARAIET